MTNDLGEWGSISMKYAPRSVSNSVCAGVPPHRNAIVIDESRGVEMGKNQSSINPPISHPHSE